MAKRNAHYRDLRPHTARVIKLAQYPTHVNGGYLDDPHRIATMPPRRETSE